MRRLLFAAVLLTFGLAGLAQRPDTPGGAGPPREERGADQQPVLRHREGSEEAPALNQHLENQGALPSDIHRPEEKGAAGAPQVPRQPALEQGTATQKSWGYRWALIIVGVILAAVILATGWNWRRRPQRYRTLQSSDIDRNHPRDRAA
jgi:hypothetical protein